MKMEIREGNALNVLLFGTGGDGELVDIKCFRGDREDVTASDIRREIHDAIMQHKMHPQRATRTAPNSGVGRVDVVEFVKGLPLAA
jgi:hypothetical protein